MSENAKVLIVDDDIVVRQLLTDILENGGFDVEEATDGQDGFRRATTGNYFAVLMDLKMPNWDGLDAINSMALIDNNARIVIVSGYMNDEIAESLASNPNVVGTLAKPFKNDDILDFLNQLPPLES